MDDKAEVTETPSTDESTPVGAVIITTLLAIIIVALWVGMYVLGILRS